MIPLAKLLKKREYREVAAIQDVIVVALSEMGAVLHGGTAVWRVYGGKRFSYDVDFYHISPQKTAEILAELEGLELVKSKTTESGIFYGRVRREKWSVEVEVSPLPRGKEIVEGRYAMVDGSTISVLTLSPEELLREKVEAYLSRRKVRDLYDIYYLIGVIKEPARAAKDLKKLLTVLDEPPKDFASLKELIIAGISPSFETIRREVLRVAEG